MKPQIYTCNNVALINIIDTDSSILKPPKERVFNAERFVTSTDTLILVGDLLDGGTSAFVSALVWQVFTHAKDQASAYGGRLKTPVVFELDEVGNAVMIPELQDWYSCAGSLGIVISSYFQSQAQGQKQFGETGFAQLRGAANVFTYGGGSTEPKFLEDISKLVGQYDHHTRSSSTSYSDGSGQSRSSSDQVQRREILSVADLARLPKGTVFLAAEESTGLIDAQYWFEDRKLVERIGPAKQWLIEHMTGLSTGQVEEMEKDQ